MSGEAGSKVREENSLLQEHLLFDHVTCPAPDITEEVTFALEDVIKQRIADKVAVYCLMFYFSMIFVCSVLG